MKFKKADLLTLLIGLFLFASCKDDSTIGLDLDPGTAIEGKLVDTLTINSTTLAESPIITTGLARHPLGTLTDPVFGKTDASIALSVNLPSDGFSFGTNAVLDSAVLVLSYGGEFYGDTTSSIYSIDVKQLTTDIKQQENFVNTKTYPANATVLGNKTDYLYPTASFKVTDIVTNGPDTLKSVTGQLRIPINKAFITNNIVNLTTADLKNDASFAAILKGFKVELNKSASSGQLGMMFFDFTGANSNLELYYKRDNALTAGYIDTVVTKFPIVKTRGPVAATITHDYTGTPVAAQVAAPATQYATTYLQGTVGLRNKISFPSLKKFSAAVGKVIVNKAELVVDISSGSDTYPFAAPFRIGLYRTDIAGQRRNISDRDFFQAQYNSVDYGDAVFGGFLDKTKKRYVFVLTDYMQNLLDNKTQDYGTYLMVSPLAEFDYTAPTGATAARVVIGSGAKDVSGNLINPTNRIKLNIYYTKVN